MPAPATVGQLRTKVSDMEIGDYIPFNNSPSDGTFILGTGGLTECPLTGVQSGSGSKVFFYMVKVAKGLLVCDRVLSHSVSWDGLNSSKYIQGRPNDFGNIIPTMTSNTSPSGKAEASSIYGVNAAWHAFDNNSAAYWVANGNKNQWLSYDFPTKRRVSKYAITADTGTPTKLPKNWRFEGWNEDLEVWDILDERTNETFSSSQRKEYVCKTAGEYKKYRLFVLSVNGNDSYTAVNQFELLEDIGVIRSLTGGVAYADANGNKSLTDKGFGGWPVNNEWDKYIVNFPVSKMQEGKTLDDIFHWNSAVTFTQDTPMNGVLGENNSTGTNSTRIGRSRTGSSINSIQVASSNGSWASWGFRPVFEYKE